VVPLRVLYLIPALDAGGAERVVIEHLRRLPRDRFAPELAVLRPEGPARAQVPADVPVHTIRTRGPIRFLARRRSLRELLDARPFDVVTSHLPYANALSLAESVGRGAPVPRVTTIHGDRRGVDRFSLASRFLLRLQRVLSRRVGRIVFLCGETATAMASAYGARPAQVAVIPNGVDPGELRALAEREPPPSWPSPGLRLLAAGRLVPQKGFDLLLRALAIARARGLEASLLILGEGVERPALERLRGELGLDGCVALPGHAANPYPAMRRADLFVLSSRFEGLPLVLLEALALGRPVVAAACPAGPAELLADGSGVLVPPRDPESMAAAILDLARDPDRRADLTRRAAGRAEAYLWPPIIDRTAAMLLETARSG
jgi:glycosyltransferase involved in cell wall biosynthesis